MKKFLCDWLVIFLVFAVCLLIFMAVYELFTTGRWWQGALAVMLISSGWLAAANRYMR